MTVTRRGDQTVVKVPWRTPGHWLGAVVTAGWVALVLGAGLFLTRWNLLNAMIVALNLALALPIALFVWVGLVNATRITVTAQGLRVCHRPVPWLGSRAVARSDASRVWTEKVAYHQRQTTLFRYDVWIRLRSGSEVVVLRGAVNRAEADTLTNLLVELWGVPSGPELAGGAPTKESR